MEVFYIHNEQRVGPLDVDAFKREVAHGNVRADTLVWHEGMPNWEPYSQISATLFSGAEATLAVSPVAEPVTNVASDTQHLDSGDAAAPTKEPPSWQVFLYLHGKKIFIGCVLVSLAFIAKYVFDHREQWMKAATNPNQMVWSIATAEAKLAQAEKHWTVAHTALQAEEHELAAEHILAGNQGIENYRDLFGNNAMHDDRIFNAHIEAALQPFNTTIKTKWRELLDKFERFEVEAETVATFQYTYYAVLHNTILQDYEKRAEKIDLSRAQQAATMVRLAFDQSYFAYGEAENYTNYLLDIVRQEVEAKVTTPPGYRLGYGEAAGQAEQEATFLSFSISVVLDYQGYILQEGSERILVQANADDYWADFEIVRSATVYLYDSYDNQPYPGQPLTNWDPYKKIEIGLNVPQEIELAKAYDAIEQDMVITQYNRHCYATLAHVLEKSFVLPKLAIQGYSAK